VFSFFPSLISVLVRRFQQVSIPAVFNGTLLVDIFLATMQDRFSQPVFLCPLLFFKKLIFFFISV